MNKQVWIEKAIGLGIQEFEIYQSTTDKRTVRPTGRRWRNLPPACPAGNAESA